MPLASALSRTQDPCKWRPRSGTRGARWPGQRHVLRQLIIGCEVLGLVVFSQAKRLQPQLVVVTGPPGTGKSTFAEYAAQLLGCPVFSKDWLEASLWRSGIGRDTNSGWAAYELLTTLAENQLR